jgi:hypothetical protein
MALANVTMKDAAGTTKKITANAHTTDEYAQVAQVGFGAEGDAPTPVSASNPLPVTANLSATDNAVLDAIQTAVEKIDDAISGSEMQVDVASIAAGDNNIGNVDLASAIPAGTNNIGATTDAGSAITVSWGVSGAPVESADMTTAANVTDAPTTGQKLVLVDAFIGVSAAMNILIEEESSGNDRLRLYFPGAGNYQVTPRAKFKHSTADKKFTCKASAAGAVSITFAYYSEV